MAVVEHHLVGLGPFQCYHEIILVSIHEAVAGRAYILVYLDGQRTARELMGQVFLGIHRIGHLCHVIVFPTTPSMTVVAAQEEVLIQVGSGLQTQSATPSVDIVPSQDGVDWADVDIVGGAGLDRVLKEGFQAENDILHAFHVFNAVYEPVHATLAFCQLHLPILIPEVFVTHLGIGLGHLLGQTFEQLFRQFFEAIVREACSSGHRGTAQKTHQREVCGHVVHRQHPLSIWQLLVFLQNLDILHKIDVALLGDGHLTATHMESRVFQNIQVAAKSHIVLIVGQELQMDTGVTHFS